VTEEAHHFAFDLDRGKRRADVGELELSKFEVVRAALEPCRVHSAMRIGALGLEQEHPWHSHRRMLRTMVGEPHVSFLYHGTLRSRLVGIAKEGLIPARRPKTWPNPGVTEHAATGVFFERDWRKASHWVGIAAYDENGLPTKGAIVRVPIGSLLVENDLRSQGSLVVRQDSIPVDDAEILLFPFTVTGQWMPLMAAVELVRLAPKPASRP
jgi:hypothetical protein